MPTTENIPTRKSCLGRIFRLWIVLLVIGFLVRNCNSAHYNMTGKTPSSVILHATATNRHSNDDYIFEVTNNDDFKWKNVTLQFNTLMDDGDHKGRLEYINPGETVHMNASELPMTGPFVDVVISCDTPQGKGKWIGNLNPRDLQ